MNKPSDLIEFFLNQFFKWVVTSSAQFLLKKKVLAFYVQGLGATQYLALSAELAFLGPQKKGLPVGSSRL